MWFLTLRVIAAVLVTADNPGSRERASIARSGAGIPVAAS
jgi:hypothetical protein